MVSVAACSIVTSLDGLSDGSGSLATAGGGGSDAHGGGEASVDGAAPSAVGDAATGGGNGTGGGDASGRTPLDAGEAPVVDAGDVVDSAAADASATSAPDAGTTVTGYCASLSPKPLFCDDFDEGSLAAPWTQVSQTNAKATLSTTSSVSGAASMLVASSGSTSNVDCAGYKTLSKLTTTGTVLTLSFDVRIEQGDMSNKSDAVLGAIQLFDSAGNLWDLQIEAYWDTNKMAIVLSEDGELAGGGTNAYYGYTANTEVALDAWTHMTLQLAMATPTTAMGPATANLSLGGGVVATASSLHMNTTSPTSEILVGLTYVTANNAAWVVRYDNVVFTSSP